jgi:hypothetical protein
MSAWWRRVKRLAPHASAVRAQHKHGVAPEMRKAKRIALAALAAGASLLVMGWILSELVVQYEIYATGARSRAELGDDLGLGILLLIVVPIGSFAGAVLVWCRVWSATKPRPGAANEHSANT